MADVTRRRFLQTAAVVSTAIGAGSLGFSTSSRASDFTLKFANNLPLSHPMNVRAREMAKAISEESNGALRIQIFPSSQLGSDTDTLAQVRSGAVDMFALSPVILGTFIPNAQISAIGFAFKDYETVWRAMDGDLGAHVRREIEKSQTLFAFDHIWDSGYRVITTSTKQITNPDDLVSMKLRVPPSPIIMSIFRSFMAAPTSINFTEVYSALQTRVVEGQENPLSIISSAKLYEVQKYCSLTNHVWDGFWMLGNSKSFARLPADLQEIVRKHVNSAVMAERSDLAEQRGHLSEELSDKGLEIYQPDPEAFRQRLRSANYYQDWQNKFGNGSWEILEKYVGKLV